MASYYWIMVDKNEYGGLGIDYGGFCIKCGIASRNGGKRGAREWRAGRVGNKG
jgi:hypothetical protein